MPAKLVRNDEKLRGPRRLMSAVILEERSGKVDDERTHARDRTVKYLVRNVERKGL
jgi:hypothetical protein